MGFEKNIGLYCCVVPTHSRGRNCCLGPAAARLSNQAPRLTWKVICVVGLGFHCHGTSHSHFSPVTHSPGRQALTSQVRPDQVQTDNYCLYYYFGPNNETLLASDVNAKTPDHNITASVSQSVSPHCGPLYSAGGVHGLINAAPAVPWLIVTLIMFIRH